VHRRRAVAELGGADPDAVPAVGRQVEGDVRDVAERRHRRDHRDGHPFADEPARGRRDAVAAREGVVGEVEALVETVAAPDEIRVGFAAVMEQVVAILHRVATTQFERIDAELDRELVHGALDREDHLAEAVASERAGGHGIGVHDLGIQPLRGASIEAQRLGDAVEEHASGVVAVGARVGEHVDVHGGEDAVLVRSERHRDPHGVTHRGALELLTPRQLVRDGPACAQHAESDEVFAEELLLAAEPAADPSGMHADAIAIEPEDVGEFVAHEERHLGARADDEAAVVVETADRTAGLELRVDDPTGAPRPATVVCARAIPAATSP
jgi:hypothetical protein